MQAFAIVTGARGRHRLGLIALVGLMVLPRLSHGQQLPPSGQPQVVAAPSLTADLRLVPGEALPTVLRLEQNSPNPFNPTTEIAFDLDRSAYVQMSIYTLLGRELARPLSRPMEPGHYVQRFTAANLASGVYVYRLTVSGASGSQTLSRRMMLLR